MGIEIEVAEMQAKALGQYITLSGAPIVPQDTLFNYGLRGAEPMEGNSDEPFSLQCPLEPKLASIRTES